MRGVHLFLLKQSQEEKELSWIASVTVERCRMLMRCFFLLYVLTFSFAPFFRDFFPVLCLLCLIPYYALHHKQSTLAFFDGKKYFVFYYIFLLLGVVLSQDIWSSFIKVSLHSFTSLTLPFVAMECIRTSRDLRLLAWVLVAALFLQGMNGVFQYYTGYDFVQDIAIKTGRLTGSFSDYRVGNYIALSLIPAMSVAVFLRPRVGIWAVPMALLCVSPALFLMIFSYTRNAYITLFAALFFWIILMRSFPWKFCLAVLGSFAAVLPWVYTRFSFDVLRNDGRWDLWRFAYEIFAEFPFFGAGIGQYNAAFTSLGLSPVKDAVSISHPHNIYLQFLCENGLVGFLLVMTFLLGMLWWGYTKLRALEQRETGILQENTSPQTLHWRVAALYWCGWGAFLVSGIVGHNFFQRWWQSLVMAFLGVMVGALVYALRHAQEKESTLP